MKRSQVHRAAPSPQDITSTSFAVSVVIPLYDKAPFIRAALESALSQSCPAQEIIIVDDGSTDDGPSRIRDLISDVARLVRQKNSGPGAARNRGIEEATQPWIAFLDADDLWTEDHLATLARVSSAYPQSAVVAAGFQVQRNPSIARISGVAEEPERLQFFRAPLQTLWTSAVAVRRDALRDLGGFGTFWPGEDIDLWVRLSLRNEIAISQRKTAIYRIGTGGLMDQLADRYSTKFELNPVLESLERAAAASNDLQQHADIMTYRDRWLGLFARQAIRRAKPAVAREYLKITSKEFRRRAMFTRVLSAFPAWLLRIGFSLRGAFRLLSTIHG